MLVKIPIANREQWLSLRMQDITATDVPAICGHGMFDSAAGVWAKKKGLAAPLQETAMLRKGRWGEAAVFEAVADTFPTWELRRAKVYLRDTAARLGATPDGVAIIPEIPGITYIEAKVVMRPVFVREWCDGCNDDDAPITAPMGYHLQTITGSMLAGASRAIIAALVHDTFDWQLRIVPIERHADAERMIRDRVAAFWRDYLDPDICPPIDPSRDAELIKVLYPKDDGTEIDLSQDNRIPELVAERETKKEALKVLAKQVGAIETEIKTKLGPHTHGRMKDGRIISYRLQERAGYTVEPTSYRVLRVSQGRRQ